MIERLPARLRTAAVARAVTAPSAILLAGAGAAGAVLAGAPLAVAAVAAVAGWAARVALAVPRRPKAEEIDPYRVGQPWRQAVMDALAAQRAFARVIRRSQSGPVRDRLVQIGERIAEGVDDCWRIACQGDALDEAISSLDVARIRHELEEVHHELERSGRGDDLALARTEQAIRAQLESAVRLRRVSEDARRRLRLLNAQLDQAVAQSVEIALDVADTSQLQPVTDAVDGVVSELDALRRALEETDAAAGDATASGST